MRLKKVIIDGKEYFVRVDKDECERDASYCNVSSDECDESEIKSKRACRIIRMLPFLDDEEVAMLAKKIIEGDPDYEGIKLAAIFPFMDDDDCDEIFTDLLNGNSQLKPSTIYSLIPFVSEDALSALVDQYIKGKYQNIDIDKIYPFLDDDDIKRLFRYELSRKDAEQ